MPETFGDLRASSILSLFKRDTGNKVLKQGVVSPHACHHEPLIRLQHPLHVSTTHSSSEIAANTATCF